MEINRNNYEAYLLDLLEGRLSVEEQQRVRDFLRLNPDCLTGLDDADLWLLEKDTVPYPDRDSLKKEWPDASTELTEHNFDLFSIARMEGDLAPEQVQAHKTVVEENREKRKEWDIWQRTILPAQPVVFAEKEQLKRKRPVNTRIIWISVISAAAAVALIVTLLRINPGITEPSLSYETEIAAAVPDESPADENADRIPNREKPSEVIPEISPVPEEEPVSPVESAPSEQPGESPVMETIEETERVKDAVVVPETWILPNPIQITRYVSGYTTEMYRGTYDVIQPLEIPPSSIHLRSLSLSQLAELDLQELFDEYTSEKNISLWSIANAGIQGINRLAGTDASLLASRDDEGDVSGFRFSSKRFTFARPFDRTE